MAKILKKALAITASAAIASSVITVPAVANAMSTATYNDGTLTVNADKAYEDATVYVAAYNADGTLQGVSMKSVSLTEGKNTISDINAGEGNRIFIWSGQTPIVVSVDEAPEETEEPDNVKVIKSWKFDFGSTEDVADGFTAVTADVNYTLNTAGEDQYGFIGTNENDYKLNGGRMDGFDQQEGQVITLSNGGGTGLNDAIGSTGADAFGNAGDKFYPVRFALKAQDEQYFRVKAYVTTFDSTKDATASLYTERKHPLYTEKTIKAGETEVTEFTVRTTPIYYEKSDPKGYIKDELVNIALLGDNTELGALKIDQIV